MRDVTLFATNIIHGHQD